MKVIIILFILLFIIVTIITSIMECIHLLDPSDRKIEKSQPKNKKEEIDDIAMLEALLEEEK